MEHFDSGVIMVDERKVIDELQAEMTRVVEDAAAGMPIELLQEALEGRAVV